MEKEFRGKVTTRLGLTRKPNDSPKNRKPKANAKRCWSASLNGYDKALKGDKPNKRRVCKTTTDCSMKTKNNLEEKLEIYIPNGPRLGTNVIEARHVAKAFGDKLLYDDLNLFCHKQVL